MFRRKLQFDKNTWLAKYILKCGKICFVFNKVAKDPLWLMKSILSPRNKHYFATHVQEDKEEGCAL